MGLLVAARDARRQGAGPGAAGADAGPVVGQLAAIRRQVWHIGHNVNQIAHQANAAGRADGRDVQQTLLAVRRCAELVDQAGALIGALEAAGGQGRGVE